ncbi:MAG: phage holin family protein [Thermodesulfobacteriota bacterium]
MYHMFVSWLILFVAVIVVTYLLPGVTVRSLGAAAITAAVLVILNALIRPILVVLTFPITIVTFGLFLLVINALIFMLASAIVPGFHVKSFWWALLGSLIVSVVRYALDSILR